MKLGRQTQKCPRCGSKALINQPTCPECGLSFAKLEMATNKAAGQRYRAHDRSAVVLTKKTPPDLKRWKLILFVTLFGLFGGHYFYTRRWWWGLLYLLGFALMFVCVYFNAYFMGTDWGVRLVEISAIFVGIYGLCWLFDILKVCLFKFKIPVSLPMPEKEQPKPEEESK